jgi:hypothetical protein
MRTFALVKEIFDQDSLEAADGFDCISPGDIKTVYEDESGFYVHCAHGRHYLEGQLNEEGTEYVEFYAVRRH